jgi:hypothetical protein
VCIFIVQEILLYYNTLAMSNFLVVITINYCPHTIQFME